MTNPTVPDSPSEAAPGLEAMPWLEPSLAYLKNLAAQDRLPHALLLSGDRLTVELALALAQHLLCRTDAQARSWVQAGSHPDLVVLKPESKSGQILIDQTRALARNATLTATGQRVFVIHPADAMNTAAANSLLKTLEEPPPDTVLILCTARRSALPATILSRCQTVLVPAPDPAELEHYLCETVEALGADQAKRIVALANGRVDDALSLALREELPDGDGIADDLDALRSGKTPVSDLAAGWLGGEVTELKLRQLAHHARDQLAGLVHTPGAAEDDLTSLWRLYDATNRCRAMLKTSARAELQLEALLLTWRDSAA
ncbi:MAG: hypothetical protein AAF736_14645 [Pseudomonadota bacterium]